MKAIINIACVYTLSVIAAGCGDSYLNENELKEYVLDPANGLVSRVEKGPIAVEVVYHPKDLVKQLQTRELTDESEKQKIVAQIDTLEYFIVRLSRKGQEIESALAGNPTAFTNAVSYLSYDIEKDIQIIHDSDTISAITTVYAGSFGMSQATSVMSVFACSFDGLSGDVKVCFDDHQFGTGRSEFVFDLRDLKSIPSLKLN